MFMVFKRSKIFTQFALVKSLQFCEIKKNVLSFIYVIIIEI